MNIILFTHPSFLGSQSMPRFAAMLCDGMKIRGHNVSVYTPTPFFYKLTIPLVRKWLGYIDQYVLFPRQIKRKLLNVPADTLYVFADQALGPWIPMVKNKPHVVHCHDFLAQRSALGEIPENPTSWSGKQYQIYIRKGYQQGKNFISVSYKTRKDLERFLPNPPVLSEVVYNGMNKVLQPLNLLMAREKLGEQTGLALSCGYILHVGGNQWYKNRKGIIEIYSNWRTTSQYRLPLLLIGASPTTELRKVKESSRFAPDIHFLTGKDDLFVQLAYSGASVFLYPSLAEGFGWPIAEAMAASCPVITTGEAPMTEVGGEAAFYIDRMPIETEAKKQWLQKAVMLLENTTGMDDSEREKVICKGLDNIKRFNAGDTLQQIEDIYKTVLEQETHL